MLTELETTIQNGWSINHIAPTIVAYNAVLHAYAKTGNAQGADRLLRRLLLEDDDNSNINSTGTDITPDETTFNTVIAAWSKSKSSDDDAPLQAEALLAIMKDTKNIQPSVVTYTSLMQCWVTSKWEGAVERAGRAELLLRDMQHNENVRVQPNIICYNIVLNAWANATRNDIRAIGRVMNLLDEVLDNNMKPSAGTFRAVLYAIAGSAVTNKSERVYALLELMEPHGIQPNTSDQKMIRRLTKNSEKQARIHRLAAEAEKAAKKGM
jgi:pentatricopeptide repeat protein